MQTQNHYDVLIVGTGFSGLYALHHFRDKQNLNARVFDGAGGIGGTWWYNRYPGARVDAPSAPFYAYTFSEELVQEWEWLETQSSQATVLEYLNFVADKLDLRRDIQLKTWIETARFNEEDQIWTIETSSGELFSCKFLVCALGALFVAHKPDYQGIDDFQGEVYHTGKWPHQAVDFTGKRVGIVGTGSSGIQAIPEIAKDAADLTVFQRTPQFTLPARNRPLEPEALKDARDQWGAYRNAMRSHPAGMPYAQGTRSALEDTAEQREKLYESLWREGGTALMMKSYRDLLTSAEANQTLADFVRGKIREVVKDAATADRLMPSYHIGTKRLILDNGYFETFNRDNVTLVDLTEDPIRSFGPHSVSTKSGERPLDVLVLATGFDAVTGSMLQLNPIGRSGLALNEKWSTRFDTCLGLTMAGFPNLFMLHGPGSPGVLFNMPMGSELQTEWIANCVDYMRTRDLATIEATEQAEATWDDEIQSLANRTLYPLTDSWYTGANIPGKPRQFLGHLNGSKYYERLSETEQHDYSGFLFEPPSRAQQT